MLAGGGGSRTGPGSHALSAAPLKLTLHPVSAVAWFIHSQKRQVSAQNVNRQGGHAETCHVFPSKVMVPNCSENKVSWLHMRHRPSDVGTWSLP